MPFKSAYNNSINKSIISRNPSPTSSTGDPNKNQKNNAIKFSDYSKRKETFQAAKNPILTYRNPEHILKNAKRTLINFDKMKERNVNSILNVNNYPSVCYYKPDLKFTQDNPKYSLDFKKERVTTKKNLILKMWGSYDVSTDYKLVKLQDYVNEQFDFRDNKNKASNKKK